jgi:hypothetical protein
MSQSYIMRRPSPPTTEPPNYGMIIGAVVGACAAAFLLFFIIFYFVKIRPRNRYYKLIRLKRPSGLDLRGNVQRSI